MSSLGQEKNITRRVVPPHIHSRLYKHMQISRKINQTDKSSHP